MPSNYSDAEVIEGLMGYVTKFVGRISDLENEVLHLKSLLRYPVAKTKNAIGWETWREHAVRALEGEEHA